MAKTNRKGRSKSGPPFIQIYNYVFDSPAYRALKPGPRALLTELIRRHNGANNGRIGLGLREAVTALNMTDRETVAGYFEMLQQHGLIHLAKDSGFNMKSSSERTAREWELAMFPCEGRPARKTFEAWRPETNLRDGKPDPTGTENPTVLTFTPTKSPSLGTEKPSLECAV